MNKFNPNIYIAILLMAALIFSAMTVYAFGERKSKEINVSARSAVLYQPETDVFLYSKNADTRLPMASTTKIMTALVALENSRADELVTVDERAVGTEGSSAYLKGGEVLTMEELTYALLLQSANDAAVAIACHVGGSIEGFSYMMNLRACELGLSDTHFTNPHGLDSDEHYTTAAELAKIAAEALKNPSFKKIASTYKRTFATEERSRTYVNHNKLLKMYDGCIGIKTGFTKKSGRCLVGAAERDGLTFVSVTLDAPSDWSDHKCMLDLGFDTLEKLTLSEADDHLYRIPLLEGATDSVSVSNPEGASLILEKGGHRVEEYVKLVRFTVAPVLKGDILGEIIYTVDGKEAARIPLVAAESVEKIKEKNFLDKLFSIFK